VFGLRGAPLLLGAVLNSVAVPVTFQVEMSYQISLGNFSSVTVTMEARGDFNGVSPNDVPNHVS
jgi:hypothetical protein